MDLFLSRETEKPHDEYVRKLQSVSTKRAAGLPRKLPDKEKNEVLGNATAAKAPLPVSGTGSELACYR